MGDNAQGKTNLLEAVYFLAHLSSFRTRRSQDLIRNGAEHLSVSAKVVRQQRPRSVRVDLVGGRRKLFVDGLVTADLADFLGSLTVLLFSPGQVELLRGSPESRRRFLDRAVMRRKPAHAVLLREYQHVLRTRNRCLRDGEWNLAELYASKIAELGGRIVAARLDLISELSRHVSRLYQSSVRSDDAVMLRYHSVWLERELGRRLTGDERGICHEVRDFLVGALERTRERERDRKHQLVGPQADDLDVAIEGLSAPRHASQGQMRSLLASLVLAEREILRQEGRKAVLLIDDLSSELDGGRRKALISYLRSLDGQVLVTGTDLDSLAGLSPGRVFRVTRGEVIEETGL